MLVLDTVYIYLNETVRTSQQTFYSCVFDPILKNKTACIDYISPMSPNIIETKKYARMPDFHNRLGKAIEVSRCI